MKIGRKRQCDVFMILKGLAPNAELRMLNSELHPGGSDLSVPAGDSKFEVRREE